jgi:hypothetical protein
MVTTSAPQNSRKLLYIVLMVTIALTLWTAISSDDVEEQMIVTPRANLGQTTQLKQRESKLNLNAKSRQSIVGFQRVNLERPMKDLFKVHNWSSPVALKNTTIKPEKTTVVAPPIPFAYGGKLEGTPQGTIVFLIENDQLYTTPIGENVNSRWRLDMETPDSLHFTYLPMNLSNVLSKSSTPILEFRPFAGLANSRND